MHTTNQKKRRLPLRAAVLILSLPWLGFYLLFRDNKSVMNALCRSLVRPFHLFAARASAHLPFSLGEALCYGAALWVLLLLLLPIIRLIRHGWDRRSFASALMSLCALGALIGALFTLLWGVYYYADGFPEESGLRDEPVRTEDLHGVTERFAALCNAYGELVQRDENGHFILDREAVFAASGNIYDPVSAKLPLQNQSGVPCKPVSRFLSYGMSATGFTGFFCPYTGEANVNTHMPDLMLPATIAHELAHQRGVAPEDYANFVGIVAALESGNKDYVYSGAVMGYIYLGNALYKADHTLWQEVYGSLSPAVRGDLSAHNAYWQQFEGKAEEVSEVLYTSLLESVGETRGMASYGACVDLLVQWYAGEAAEKLPAEK